MQQMAENLGLLNPFLVTQLSTNSQSYSPQAALLQAAATSPASGVVKGFLENAGQSQLLEQFQVIS